MKLYAATAFQSVSSVDLSVIVLYFGKLAFAIANPKIAAFLKKTAVLFSLLTARELRVVRIGLGTWGIGACDLTQSAEKSNILCNLKKFFLDNYNKKNIATSTKLKSNT